METVYEDFSSETEEESSGVLIRKISKVKSGRNSKEYDTKETFNIETKADEVPSVISNIDVVENTVEVIGNTENDRDNCSGEEGRIVVTKEAELSEITCVDETVRREYEEHLKRGGSSEHIFNMFSSNDSAAMTMPDKTQGKAKLVSSVYFVEEEGNILILSLNILHYFSLYFSDFA